METYPAEKAFGVPLALTQFGEGLDALAVKQPEVAHVLQHIEARGVVEDFIEQQRQLLAQPTLRSTVGTLGIHILISLFPIAQHFWDQGWRMLQVGVHYHHAVARHIVKSSQHGVLLAKVARQVHIVHALVVGTLRLDNLQRVVFAAIVHIQHLPFVTRLRLHERLQFGI